MLGPVNACTITGLAAQEGAQKAAVAAGSGFLWVTWMWF